MKRSRLRSSNFAVLFASLVIASLATTALAGTFTTGTFATSADVQGAPYVLAENTGSATPVTLNGGTYGPESFFTGDNPFTGTDAFANPALQSIMGDGRYANSMSATLPVTAGTQYRLELLFWDPVSGYTAGSRLMTITAGSEKLTGFDVIGTTGGWKANEARKVDYTFTASSSTLSLNLLGIGGGDTNAFLNGFSLTLVPEPSSLVLCGLGAVGLLVAARRRKA